MTCFTLQGSFANAHRKDSFIPFLTLHLEDIFTKKVIFMLDLALRRHFHKEGYIYEKRKFKLFTFSRLLGKIRNIKDGFEFTPPLKLVISPLKEKGILSGSGRLL